MHSSIAYSGRAVGISAPEPSGSEVGTHSRAPRRGRATRKYQPSTPVLPLLFWISAWDRGELGGHPVSVEVGLAVVISLCVTCESSVSLRDDPSNSCPRVSRNETRQLDNRILGGSPLSGNSLRQSTESPAGSSGRRQVEVALVATRTARSTGSSRLRRRRIARREADRPLRSR